MTADSEEEPFLTQSNFDKKYGRVEAQSTSVCSSYFRRPTFLQIIAFLPIIDQFRYYKKSNVMGDLVSGFTVGVMHIPQGMAYAVLASLPPVVGLYSSFFAPMIYAIFGSSLHISVATFAPVSIMVSLTVDSIKLPKNCSDVPCSESDYMDIKTQCAASLNFVVGLILMVLSVCRLGFIGDYFSQNMVKGLTLGIACHVMTSQVVKVLGLSLEKQSGPGSLILSWIVCILLLFGAMHANRQLHKACPIPVPIELVLVVAGIVISQLCRFETKFGISVVGTIPTGLPMPSFPMSSFHVPFMELLENAVVIVLISYAVTLALGKTFAQKKGYSIDANQELLALGITDFVTSFVSCYPVAASPSRSSVQVQAGGKTQVVSFISSGLLLFVLLFLGSYVGPLPLAVLGSIIIFALRSYFLQCTALPDLWRIDRLEVSIFVLTALVTICVSIFTGLIFGISFSLATVLWRSQTPNYVQMGRIEGTEFYRDVERYERCELLPGILIFRFNMSIFFANSDRFFNAVVEKVKKREVEPIETDVKLHCLILDFETFNFIDHTGIRTLFDLKKWLEDRDITLVVCRCRGDILDKMEDEKLKEELGDTCLFPSIEDAVKFYLAMSENMPNLKVPNGDFVKKINDKTHSQDSLALEKINGNNNPSKESYEMMDLTATHV